MPVAGKRKRPALRLVIGLCAVLVAAVVASVAVDMRQARVLAGEACRRAEKGMLLDDLLASIPEKDYRRVKGADRVFLVPRKGMGRFNCTVSHDGRRITGAQVDFLD